MTMPLFVEKAEHSVSSRLFCRFPGSLREVEVSREIGVYRVFMSFPLSATPCDSERGQ